MFKNDSSAVDVNLFSGLGRIGTEADSISLYTMRSRLTQLPSLRAPAQLRVVFLSGNCV